MWPFSSSKKPIELSEAAKEKYAHASTDELLKQKSALKEERDHPSLSTWEHAKSFGAGVTLSPEGIAGQVIGGAAQIGIGMVDPERIANGVLKNSTKALQGWTGIAITQVGVPVVLGLNAYRRYTNRKREHINEEKQAELTFVEKVLAEREAVVTEKSR